MRCSFGKLQDKYFFTFTLIEKLVIWIKAAFSVLVLYGIIILNTTERNSESGQMSYDKDFK